MGKVLGSRRAGLDPRGEAAEPSRHRDVPPQHALTQHPAHLRFPGLSEQSPLGRILAAALAGQVQATFTGGTAPARRRWRHLVHGTDLQWWSTGPSAPADPPATGLIIDLHGSSQPGQGRRWRVVDGAGVPLLAAFHAVQTCHRAPFTASLYLVEDDGAGTASNGSCHLLAEAHISSIRRYRPLLDALGQTTAHLLRTALRRTGRPAPSWNATPPAPSRAMPLARARAAATTTWLRARIGGDLYGIAMLPATAASLLQDAVIAPPAWTEIPARHGFIADPFFWPGRPGIALCEAYAHTTGRGHLAAIAITPGAKDPAPTRPILATDHHLSYPFTFTDGERTLCLPEMAAARRQLLYEVHDGQPMSPLCVIAENVTMADPTPMRHDGLYWISYTDAALGEYDNLCLMFAEHLAGPWRPHPGNPVKIDIRSSRPAGTPFHVDGHLYRPAQDCSRTYGGALVINRIRTCTPLHYDEEPVATLRPDPVGRFPDGLHTLAYDGEHILIDGKRISYHPAILWQKIRRRLPSAFRPGPATSMSCIVPTQSV